MIELKLPFWMDGERAQGLVRASKRWWSLVASWLRLPFSLLYDTKDIRVVDLLAWQRQIDRFEGEPESLYRLRVKHAFVNALDAGTPAGMQRIFSRLEMMDDAVFRERVPGFEWDQIELSLRYQAYADHSLLLNVLLDQYGRTCRRWLFRAILPVESFGVVIAVMVNEPVVVMPRILPIVVFEQFEVAAGCISLNEPVVVMPRILPIVVFEQFEVAAGCLSISDSVRVLPR